MVSKTKELEKSDENALADAICSSAHQIWQAGLGAFGRAQEGGTELFSKLVEEGTGMQGRLRNLAGDKDFGVADTVTRLAGNVGRQASDSWERMEKVFEERVARSLRGFGVPTREDIKALGRQIDELNQAVAALSAQKKPAAGAAGRSAANAARAEKAEKMPAKSSVKTPKPTVRASTKKTTRTAVGHA
jgi:poly(hydroxyalkanoate) granule-associated protein